MQKVIILIIVVAVGLTTSFAQSKSRVAPASSAATNVNPFHDADRLITNGENFESDKQSLSAAEKALGSDGGNYQWLWRLSRACYFVGENAPKAEKLKYYERGVDAGLKAVKSNPNGAEAHFWLGVNYGGHAEEKGVFKALQLIGKIRSEMETVLRLNDRYQDAGAYLALGEMDRQLPRIIGGNTARAITRLEQGLRIAPDNLEIKLALAQAYRDVGRTEDARMQLKEIIGRPVHSSRASAERDVQEKARRLLGKF